MFGITKVEGIDMFNVGDVVKLKSGGPIMTIGETGRSDSVFCVWFINNESGSVSSYSFKPDTLELYVEPEAF